VPFSRITRLFKYIFSRIEAFSAMAPRRLFGPSLPLDTKIKVLRAFREILIAKLILLVLRTFKVKKNQLR
jgi:hypothetical protein